MSKKPSAARLPLSSPRCLINCVSFTRFLDAVDPLYEADRHAKTQLKTHVRGVRPLECALEERSDPEAEAIRGYFLAIRNSLTDGGRPPLEASGLKLQERLTRDSATPLLVSNKKSLPPALKHLCQIETSALSRTATLWPPIKSAYGLVYQAAHILANQEEQTEAQVLEAYLA